MDAVCEYEMYDKKSLKAEEFINDGEILDTLKYADENKDNLALIDKIIDKARLRKGLDHREASVLLACEDSERIAKIYDLTDAKAKDRIIKTDKKRSSYYNYYTSKRWGDADSYDLCIDSGKMGVDGSVELVLNAIQLKEKGYKTAIY